MEKISQAIPSNLYSTHYIAHTMFSMRLFPRKPLIHAITPAWIFGIVSNLCKSNFIVKTGKYFQGLKLGEWRKWSSVESVSFWPKIALKLYCRGSSIFVGEGKIHHSWKFYLCMGQIQLVKQSITHAKLFSSIQYVTNLFSFKIVSVWLVEKYSFLTSSLSISYPSLNGLDCTIPIWIFFHNLSYTNTPPSILLKNLDNNQGCACTKA